MSTPFSKNKEKRSRSPSEANKSFVKNVTSKVSGLLPTTITKWFSSPSTSRTNGSTPASADLSDSSSEDEVPESPVVTQPPAKRMRIGSPGRLNHYSPPDTKTKSTNTDSGDSFSAGVIQSPPNRSTFRKDTNFLSTPLQQVHPSKEETTVEGNEKDTSVFKMQHTISHSTDMGHSVTKKRKSLFDTSPEVYKMASAKTSYNTVRDPNQPSFKPSLLGSPFYPGRTTYGGASSSYMNQPNIKQRKTTLINSTSNNDNVSMSHSARRIMDLLENYSSPLMEAKRISQYMKTSNNESFNTSPTKHVTVAEKQNSYKTQELHVPSIASILRLKQKSRLMDTTSAARQIIASHSSVPEFSPYPSQSCTPKHDSSDKLTTKVVSRLTRTNRGDALEKTNNVAVPVALPTAVLQIDRENLPKFNFGSAERIVEKAANDEEQKTATTYSSETTTSMENYKIKTTSSKDWKCNDCWVSNKADIDKCVCCGGKNSVENTQSNKCIQCKVASATGHSSKCMTCENITNKSDIITASKVTDTSKWKCGDCWVNNDQNVDKCICCGGRKPMQTSAVEKITSDLSEWKCDICWVKNKNDVNNCIACGGAKSAKADDSLPKQNNVEIANNTTTDATFKNIMNSQKNKWECPHCLVRNDIDKSKCICCDAERADSSKDTEKKIFNFSPVPNTSFKFGIDPKVQEDNLKKSDSHDKNESEKVSAVSETNNNILPKAPTFTFGIPSKIIENKANSEEVKEVPKPSFTFGIPKDVTSPTAPVFGLPKKSPEKIATLNDDNEKVQEVPKIDFGVTKVQDSSKPTPTFFGSPSQIVQENLTLPNKSVADQKSEVSENSLVPTSNAKSLQPIFGFPSIEATNKPNMNSFSAPTVSSATTTTTASALFSPIQISLATSTLTLFQNSQPTSTTSAISLFQKKDALPSSVSNFQKIEAATATTAPPSISSVAPIFSFGNNNQNVLTQNEKPKFNFSFGNNNKSETPMFNKPMFDMTSADNNSNSIKFNMSTPNIIGNSTLSSNTLNSNLLPINPLGGNGLPGSMMSGNNLSNNALSGNMIAGNSLNNSISGNALGGNAMGGNALSGNIMGESGLAANAFRAPGVTGNTIGGNGNALRGNGLSANPFGGSAIGGNNASGGNSLTSNVLSGNGISSGNSLGSERTPNPLALGNSLAPGNNMSSTPGGIFGTSVQKENLWSSSNTGGNLFGSNSSANSLPKPAAFTFGSNTGFNANNATPAFGNNTQPPQNVFGMGNQNNNQPSMFPSQPNIFGSPPPNNPAPSMGMFGTPNPAPAFGTTNQSISSFDAPSLTPAPAPAFNFGAQQSAPVFGFGQQPQQQQAQQQAQQQQPQQAGVYNFGVPASGTPQVQFVMGSAPNTSARRLRKAVRRTTPR